MIITKQSHKVQGPVVQSIVSFTSPLSGQLYYNFITKYTDIFVEKMREAFALTFLQQKYWHIWDITVWNFNETLTNDVVCFEEPQRNVSIAAVRGAVRSSKTHKIALLFL